MNRFTCLLPLPFYFLFFITTDFQAVVSALVLYSAKISCCCRVSVDLYGWAPVEPCHGARGKTFCCAGSGSQLFARFCPGFARASSYLGQANSSLQPPQGQGCRWPGGSLPGLPDQTGTLEEV